MENGCLRMYRNMYRPWCDHTSQERGHLQAFNPLTSGNTHGKSASARAFAVYAFGACITIQLLQLADANFEHSDIISSVNGGLIINCVTLFFCNSLVRSLPHVGTIAAFGPIVRFESECYARARRHNMLRRMPVNFAARGCKHSHSIGDKISTFVS